MTDTDEYLRPEGRLFQDELKRQGKSMRELADAIEMSEARVRNIINGYQAVGQKQRIKVIGPEDTLAKMAAALDITPEQLEEADRHDAAHALKRRLPGGPMPEWAEGVENDDAETWRMIVAQHEEIREWAEDPENYLPPDAMLGYFSIDSLMGEVSARLERAERAFGPYYWLSGANGADGPLKPFRRVPRLSAVDDTMAEAALETEQGLDESPGGSDPDVE